MVKILKHFLFNPN